MDKLLDVSRETGGTPRGVVKLIDCDAEKSLVDVLVSLGFELFVIEGANIKDRQSLFENLKEVFSFPDYFGGNWDAFDDCFSSFIDGCDKPVAIIWRDADQTCENAFRPFLRAVVVFSDLEKSPLVYPSGKQIQVEVFWLGPSSKGFSFKPREE